MAQTVRLQFRPAPLKHLLHDQNGAVGNYISGRGNRVARRARSLVAVRSGKLRRSIKAVYRGDLKNPAVEVKMGGPDAPYAMAYHEGHRAFTLPQKSTGIYAFTPSSDRIRLKSGRLVTLGETVFTKGPISIGKTVGHPVLEIAARQEGLRLSIRRNFG